MPQLCAALSQNTVFQPLGKKEITWLAQQGMQREYPKDQLIALTGESWPYLFLVLRGKVTALKESSEGRLLVIAVLQPGEIFWGLDFFEDELTMPVTLQAVEPCRLCLWNREQILPVIKRNGEFSWNLSRLMVRKMQRASSIVEELAFHPITCRLARFLLSYYGADSGGRVSRDLTLDEIAARIGTTREVVCRVLYRFSQEGAIDIQRTEFTFIDREKLVGYTRSHSEPC